MCRLSAHAPLVAAAVCCFACGRQTPRSWCSSLPETVEALNACCTSYRMHDPCLLRCLCATVHLLLMQHVPVSCIKGSSLRQGKQQQPVQRDTSRHLEAVAGGSGGGSSRQRRAAANGQDSRHYDECDEDDEEQLYDQHGPEELAGQVAVAAPSIRDKQHTRGAAAAAAAAVAGSRHPARNVTRGDSGVGVASTTDDEEADSDEDGSSGSSEDDEGDDGRAPKQQEEGDGAVGRSARAGRALRDSVRKPQLVRKHYSFGFAQSLPYLPLLTVAIFATFMCSARNGSAEVPLHTHSTGRDGSSGSSNSSKGNNMMPSVRTGHSCHCWHRSQHTECSSAAPALKPSFAACLTPPNCCSASSCSAATCRGPSAASAFQQKTAAAAAAQVGGACTQAAARAAAGAAAQAAARSGGTGSAQSSCLWPPHPPYCQGDRRD